MRYVKLAVVVAVTALGLIPALAVRAQQRGETLAWALVPSARAGLLRTNRIGNYPSCSRRTKDKRHGKRRSLRIRFYMPTTFNRRRARRPRGNSIRITRFGG